MDGSEAQKRESERQRLEEECRELRTRLESIRKRRQRVHRLLDRDVSDTTIQWEKRYNEKTRSHVEALADYRSAVCQQQLTAHRLNVAQKCNVINDCFYIWHRGPFGTINGLRLGSEVPALPAESTKESTSTMTSVPTNGGHVGKQGGMFGRAFQGENTPIVPANDTISVPWAEVNSALGLVALLLSTLQHKPHSGFHFKNEIVAMGSTSKIGVRRGDAVIFYDLYTDDSFHFFGKRNFNIALTGLGRCLAEAEETVRDRDPTLALPHAIDASSRGEMTIGGLPIAYGPQGEQWTRAMKYLLTDVKWLVAFVAKHVDK